MTNKEVIATGATVDEAIENGCNQIGENREDVSIEIIDMPVKKTFGLFGGNPAKVRVYIENLHVKAALKYLTDIVDLMSVTNLNIDVTEDEEGAVFDLSGDNINIIIGKHGETMDSLQYLTGLVANKVHNSYYRITLNTGNYREKREKTLIELAKKIATGCLKTGRNTSLEPMNPYERRIIHSAVQQVEGAKSWSIGENINRHVVIGPINKPAFSNRPRSGGGYNKPRGGYSNNRNNNSANKKPYNKKPYDKNRDNKFSNNSNSFNTEKKPASKKIDDAAFPLYGKIDR